MRAHVPERCMCNLRMSAVEGCVCVCESVYLCACVWQGEQQTTEVVFMVANMSSNSRIQRSDVGYVDDRVFGA
jgi:hypothetical protein